MKKKDLFDIFVEKSVYYSGSYSAVILAFAIIIVWIITGPMFKYSDSWQMVINTITNIVTFLLVFLIQSSQNRDSKALQRKLSELMRATEGAQAALLDLEKFTDKEIANINNKYVILAEKSRKRFKWV